MNAKAKIVVGNALMVLVSAVASVLAQTPASTNDPTVIAKKLASADPAIQQSAIDDLNDLGGSDPHTLGINLAKWGEPLLATKRFDDAKKLAELIVLRRALEPPVFMAADKYWVTACIRQASAQPPAQAKADWNDALPLAKGYYNAAALANSAQAANLLAEVLAQARDTAAATDFLKQQAAADASTPTSRPSEILRSIRCDQTHFDFAIQYLKGRGSSYPSLMSQGDYLLLDDRPAEARASFESACQVAGNKGKQVREAVEGVARAMRAQDGNFAHANAFIESLRDDAATAGANLITSSPDSPQATDIQTAAGIIKLADVNKLDPAPAVAK